MIRSSGWGAGLAPLPADPFEARKEFRSRYVSRLYSGPLHFLFANLLGIAILIFCSRMIDRWGWPELVVFALTFFYANFVEYFAHKNIMHKPVPGLRLVFQRHSLHHHTVLTYDAYEIESAQDFKMVLFPPYLLLFFVLFFLLPVEIAARFLPRPGLAQVILMALTLYFIQYELLHLIYHLPRNSRLGRISLFRKLSEHHRVHHDRSLMSHYHFNVTYPIADRVFRAMYRGAKK